MNRPSPNASQAGASSPTKGAVAEEKVASNLHEKAALLSQSEPLRAPSVQEATPAETLVSDGPPVDPSRVVAPNTDNNTTTSLESSVKDKKANAPQVVHLPSKEVQEARLRSTEQKLEKAADKERREDEKLSVPHANVPTDLVSSPSSTVGAYSQATPHAPHHHELQCVRLLQVVQMFPFTTCRVSSAQGIK